MKPHQVAIVVDPIFGRGLVDLSKRVHVWISATDVNLEIAKEVLSTIGDKLSLEFGVTTFKFKSSHSPEEILLSIIGIVNEHHGEFSHGPPWSILEVYGVSPTPAIKSKFSEYGKGSFREIGTGFIFTRL
jgi:hypothetical protein